MPHPFYHPFESPYHKANWGFDITKQLSEKIEEYKEVASAEMKPDPYSEPHPEFDFYRMAFDPPMPLEIPLMTGDAIHNLRSSLDIMICDIAELRGQDRIYKFPFAETEEKLKVILEKETKKLGQDICDKILEMRPYKGEKGNAKLRALHDLDIADKHRIIVPYFGAASKLNPNFGGPEFSFQLLNSDMTFYETQRLQVKKGLGKGFNDKFDRIEDPYFPKLAGPYSGKSLVIALYEMYNMVADIIDSFAALFEFSGESDNPDSN